jgi:hypothetical protein
VTSSHLTENQLRSESDDVIKPMLQLMTSTNHEANLMIRSIFLSCIPTYN